MYSQHIAREYTASAFHSRYRRNMSFFFNKRPYLFFSDNLEQIPRKSWIQYNSSEIIFTFVPCILMLSNLLLVQLMHSQLALTFSRLKWRIGRAPNSIPIHSYIQQDAKLHSLFISGNCSTCFGLYFHPSSGAHTTVSTASGICHNAVTAICRYRGRVGTGFSVLWVAYATHSIQLYALLMMGGCTTRNM
jgi:hypothetical protein